VISYDERDAAMDDRVADEIREMMERLSNGPADMRLAVVDGFSVRREQLLRQKLSMTAEQQRQAGKQMFEAAKFASRNARDRAAEIGAYVDGLAALWLESGGAGSEKAVIAHSTLEEIFGR
jgi:hypothetical protein